MLFYFNNFELLAAKNSHCYKNISFNRSFSFSAIRHSFKFLCWFRNIMSRDESFGLVTVRWCDMSFSFDFNFSSTYNHNQISFAWMRWNQFKLLPTKKKIIQNYFEHRIKCESELSLKTPTSKHLKRTGSMNAPQNISQYQQTIFSYRINSANSVYWPHHNGHWISKSWKIIHTNHAYDVRSLNTSSVCMSSHHIKVWIGTEKWLWTENSRAMKRATEKATIRYFYFM